MAHVAETRSRSSAGTFLAIYAGWIALCAVLAFALRGMEDPSRRAGRILQNDAGRVAVNLLRQRDPGRFRHWEAVHIAYARRGEGGAENRWVVLCDDVPHTALREALVVELRAADGGLISIRRPVPRTKY